MTDMLDDEELGYGKPPKRSRFKKGKSGNPKGRPRRKRLEIDPEASLYEQLMQTEHELIENGRKIRLTFREIASRKFMSEILKGNMRAIALWLRYEERYGHLRPAPDPNAPRGGVLVVGNPYPTAEAHEAAFGGVRPQPTLPILEKFRKELGMPPTNAGLPGFDEEGNPLPGHDEMGRRIKK